jgi:hypothetical protein
VAGAAKHERMRLQTGSAGTYWIINPHRDLSSLAQYALPAFRDRASHHAVSAKANPDRA